MFFLIHKVKSQSDTTKTISPKVNLCGFVDVFYVYDFSQPPGASRQPFLFNHNRHNEFNLNLGFIKISTQHQKYRANIALQCGTYANDNYTSEPGLLKNIFEANAGISLNKKNNLWLDAGIFASHIGFESTISLEN
ncbi:MAG: outer membrane beta-barrel protein [Bacteroidia bacterium]